MPARKLLALERTYRMSTNLMEAHSQWATRPQDERFQTLDALAESVGQRRLKSRSVDIDATRLEVKSDQAGLLTINGTIQPSEPSHWSFGQLSNLVGAPASYLRKLPMDLVVQNLNHGIKNGLAKDAVKFMTVERDSGPNILQAVTSSTYGRIWDADCVAAVQRIVERSNGRFFNPKAYAMRPGMDSNGFKSMDASRTEPAGLYASDHDVFMFLIDGGSLLDGGDRAKLHRGFFCWNSETGARSFGLTTFLFNAVCGNNIVWGAQDINKLVIRHTSGGPYRFDGEAMSTLNAYVNASAAPIESAVRKAQSYILCDGTGSIESLESFLSSNGKFSRSEVRSAYDFAKAEEGKCETLWDAVQGLTAYARGFDFVDARVDLETRAGKLLNLVAESALN